MHLNDLDKVFSYKSQLQVYNQFYVSPVAVSNYKTKAYLCCKAKIVFVSFIPSCNSILGFFVFTVRLDTSQYWVVSINY